MDAGGGNVAERGVERAVCVETEHVHVAVISQHGFSLSSGVRLDRAGHDDLAALERNAARHLASAEARAGRPNVYLGDTLSLSGPGRVECAVRFDLHDHRRTVFRSAHASLNVTSR